MRGTTCGGQQSPQAERPGVPAGVSCAPPRLTLTAEGNGLQGGVVLQQGGFLLLWDGAKETPGTVVANGLPHGLGQELGGQPLGREPALWPRA